MSVTGNDPVGAGRIVVGIDGSESSLAAVRWAARQAELTGASLEVATAWQFPGTYAWGISLPETYDPSEDLRKLLSDAVTQLRKEHPGLRVTSRLAQSHPSPFLVELSKGADLLVVGSRGHGEFVGMVLGSVSEHCVSKAHCPVLVYRDPT
jgi:nucleotide-binding universal stress UspA family protein